MKSTRVLATVAAVVMAMGVLAGPAQAADGARHKARTHVAIKAQRDPAHTNYKAVGARLTRAGKAYANKRVIVQYKTGSGHWRTLRGIGGRRTDANGVAAWEICVIGARPPVRVHFGGDHKSKPADSRSVRATRC